MKRISILFVFFFMSFAAMAGGGNSSDKSSGCGLGWKVTSRMSLFGSSTRSTTNSTLGGTLGTTFGTSGCDRHDIVLNEKRAIHYAEANYDSLILEMAAGQGEYLEGFATTLGCEPQPFANSMRLNYERILKNGLSAEPFLGEVQAVIQTDPALRSHCASSVAI